MGLLEASGLKPAEASKPAAVRRFVRYAAPTLVHESVHALNARALGAPFRGCLEEELTATAGGADVVRQTPSLWTASRRKVGGLRLDLIMENARWEAARAARNASDPRVAHDAKAGAFIHDGRMLELEAALAKAREELKEPVDQYALDLLAEAAALDRGLNAFMELIKLRHPEHISVFSPRAEIDGYIRRLEDTVAYHALAKDDARRLANAREALAQWSDAARLAKARAHYRRLLGDIK